MLPPSNATTAEGNTLNLSQLSPNLSLRVLQKICQHPDIKAKNQEVYKTASSIKDLKHNLQLRLRAYMLERSLALEKNMSYFYSHQVMPKVYFPKNCTRANNKDWQKITSQHQELQRLRPHLRSTMHLRWQENIRTLLSVSYELMFIKHVLLRSRLFSSKTRNWQRAPFWSPAVKKVKIVSFPPIYPVDLGKMHFSYPQERIQKLYNEFPLLRWREMEHLESHGDTLDYRIFEIAFLGDFSYENFTTL